MKYKVCSKCKEELPIYKFHKNKYNRDGFQTHCKECRKKKYYGDRYKLPSKEGYKYCNRCGEELPATLEYFHKSKKGLYGLTGQCKECRSTLHREYRITTGITIPKPVPRDGFRYCNICNQELPATTEYFWKNSKNSNELLTRCIECIRKKSLGDEWKPLPPKPIDGYKICKVCDKELLATEKYFNKHKSARYDLSAMCIDCEREFKGIWRENHKEDIAEYSKKYNVSDGGRKAMRRHNRKMKAIRRDMGYIELIPNPFSGDEKIDWHHFMGVYVIALPRDLHRLYPGSKYEMHKEMCMEIAKQIYLYEEYGFTDA